MFDFFDVFDFWCCPEQGQESDLTMLWIPSNPGYSDLFSRVLWAASHESGVSNGPAVSLPEQKAIVLLLVGHGENCGCSWLAGLVVTLWTCPLMAELFQWFCVWNHLILAVSSPGCLRLWSLVMFISFVICGCLWRSPRMSMALRTLCWRLLKNHPIIAVALWSEALAVRDEDNHLLCCAF